MKYSGLTYEEIEYRKKNGFVNTGTVIKTKTIGQIFYTNICTWFNLVNILIATGLILVGSYKNILFLGVVFWNIVIGVVQELRAKKTIDKLSIISSPTAETIRNGKNEKVKLDELVLDDVCVYKNGNQICADSIILEGKCEVNESLLTGESDPVFKSVGDEILSGSFIISGKVTAKIIHVGNDNYVNSITKSAKYLKKVNSEIFNSIKKIVKIISFCLAPIFFVLLFKQIIFQELTFRESYVSTSASIIGMIPSGLILLISMVMALSTIRLARKKILVQEMYCVETLARVNVLCLDKTGTITEGRMKVEKLVPLNDKYDEALFKYELSEFINAFENENQTSLAVKEFCDVKDFSWKLTDKIEFSSEKKWSMASFEEKGSYFFGATERFQSEEILKYQKKGKRVLVFMKADETAKQINEATEIIGYVVISDPVKKDAADTLEFLKEQGIKIKILSGDNVYTVANIAKEAGVEGSDMYVDATTLDTPEKIKAAAIKYNVFGRVTPNQKYEIIKALKDEGLVTGMVGDGTNDVVALKEADCSIAMQNGSEAARNVANIVLLNSDFESIPHIFNEGRKDINNLQRSSSLFLMKTTFSIIMAVAFIFLPYKYPFIPIQLTLISSMIIGIPSFILALEPNCTIVEGSFLKNVLSKSISAGITIILGIAGGMVLAILLRVSGEEYTTWAFMGLMVSSMIEILKVCLPFTVLRGVLVVTVYAVLLVLSILMRGFFSLALFDTQMIIYGSAVYIALFLTRIVLFNKYKNSFVNFL